MKTPEQMAKEYCDQDKVAFAAINRDAEDLVLDAFLAGYQAAKSEYEAKIRELETELDNWKHCAVHGDDGL